MDDSLITDEGLENLYRANLKKDTGIFNAGEVEEDIQAGKQINQEQLDVLNNYWKIAGRQKIANRPTQEAVEGLSLQTQENVGFFTKLKNKFFGRFAKKSAQGNPVQEQASQKFTVKKEEADRVRDKIAGRHNPYADHVSYDMAWQLNNRRWMQKNTFNEAEKQGVTFNKNSITFTRIFPCYVQGYRAKDFGELTTEDEKRRDADIEWIKNYLSTDEKEHNSAIDKVVDDLLKLKLTPAMLKDSYIRSHTAEIRTITDYGTMLSDLKTQNPDYFAHMDPIKDELLTARFRNFNALFSITYVQRLFERGLKETGEYVDGDKERLDVIINGNKKQNEPKIKIEEKKDWFSKRDRTEKMVTDLEKSRQKEEKKLRTQMQKDLKERKKELRNSGVRIFDRQLSSYVSAMEEITTAQKEHQAEYQNTEMLIDAFTRSLQVELGSKDESELKANSYAAVGKQLEKRKKLSPEQERMKELADKSAVFFNEQVKLYESNSTMYRGAIDALLTGRQPSEEFWNFFKQIVEKNSFETLKKYADERLGS